MTTPALESVDRSQTYSRSAHDPLTAGERRPGLLRVLTYHRVAELADRPDLDPRLISTTPAVFDQQMRYLAGHFKVVSLNEVLETLKGGKRLPDRAVLITFDDAYCDFTDYAWPILKRHKLPVTTHKFQRHDRQECATKLACVDICLPTVIPSNTAATALEWPNPVRSAWRLNLRLSANCNHSVLSNAYTNNHWASW